MDITHFIQAARHPDPDRVMVMDKGTVRAEEEHKVGQTHSGRKVTTEFRQAVKARFGNSVSGLDHLDRLESTGTPLRARDVRHVVAANNLRFTRDVRPDSDAATTGSMHVVSVGGGPRASTQVCAEIDLMLRPDFDTA